MHVLSDKVIHGIRYVFSLCAFWELLSKEGQFFLNHFFFLEMSRLFFLKSKYIFLTAGQSSDSEDLPVLDSSSKCTPVKHINASKPQKISRSPARVISPHIKDGEKDKHREKHHHQNASPRVYKWSFQLSKNYLSDLIRGNLQENLFCEFWDSKLGIGLLWCSYGSVVSFMLHLVYS